MSGCHFFLDFPDLLQFRSEMSPRPYATGLAAAGGISDDGGNFRRHSFGWRKQILGERPVHCVP